jgi:autotransporter-associated beta strand protein
LVGNSFRLTEGIYNDVASGDTTITADFVISGNFISRVSNASRLLLEGGVTGNAPWRKTGTGTLRLTGTAPNSQSEMEVWEGELELDKASGVNAISTRLEIGDGTNDVRVTLLSEHQIADTADVTIRNRARLDLNGQDEAIDRLQGDGLVSLDGRFIPGRSARLTVSSGTFNGTIVGNGGLTKTGSSSSALTLSGENTFSGVTILDGGTLAVEGVQVHSPIRLNGGLLRGRGSVGSITGNLGGVVQPGVSTPAFQNRFFCRDIAFNSTTTFRPLLTSFDPGFENSQLQVSGTVSLGGSVLSVDLLGNFKPTNGTSFLIIDNDGSDAIVGTFAGLPEGAVFGGDGLPFRISYVGGTGNDVVITRVAAPASTLSSITLLSNGQMRVEGLGIGDVIYPIQAASNLNPVIFWTNVGNGTGDAGGLFRFIDAGASNRPMRFYRAVSP